MKASQLGQVKLDIDPLQAWFAGQVKPWAEYQEANVATLQDRVVHLETTVCRMELILESIIRRNIKTETIQEEKEEVEEGNEDEGEVKEAKQEQEEEEETANETEEVHEEEKGDNRDEVQERQAAEKNTPSVDSIGLSTPNEKAAETKAPTVDPIDLLIPNENFYYQETDKTTKNGVVDSAASKVDVVDQEPIKSAKKNGVLVSNTKESNGEDPNLEHKNIKSGYEAFVREYVTFPEDASDLTREEAYWASSIPEESSPFRSIDLQDTSTEQTPPPSPVQPTSSSSSVPHDTPTTSRRGVAFTASATSESGNVVVERRTKVVFVKEKEHMHLIGTGVRLLGAVSVYAVGVYAYKDFLQGTYKTATDIQRAVARHSLLISLRLILRLKADRMARAFSAAVKPRYETYTSHGTDSMQAFHDIIARAFEDQKGVAKKKTEIEFFLSPTGVGLFVNRMHKGSIEDVRLRRAVSDIFFDEKAASPSLKKNCLDYFGGPVV